MNYEEKANGLLKALAIYMRQPVVQLNKDQQASIFIGHYKFRFSLSESGQYLLSQAPIAMLPTDKRRSEVLRSLAASNYSSSGEGGILGLEKTTGLVWLTYRFWLELETPETFLKSVAIQSGLAGFWLKTITASRDEEFPDYPMI
jgi:hypothetical protein